MNKKQVILVDSNDNEIGVMEKMQAHIEGALHRAFSVFLFNKKGELLLQQRALEKYHSGGLWTNTCCSHPAPGEPLEAAVKKRLQEEMGITCDTKYVGSFLYCAKVNNMLTEHALDHVFVGSYTEAPSPSAQEVAAWRYSSISEIKKELSSCPEKYTAWFEKALNELVKQKYI